MDPVKLNAAIGIAFNLITSGVEIFNTLKGKEEITNEELLALIDRENNEQVEARQKLKDLLEN